MKDWVAHFLARQPHKKEEIKDAGEIEKTEDLYKKEDETVRRKLLEMRNEDDDDD